MTLSNEQREEIQSDISTHKLLGHARAVVRIDWLESLLASEQALRESAEHWTKATEHWQGRFEATVDSLITTQEQLNQAIEVLKDIKYSLETENEDAFPVDDCWSKVNAYLSSLSQEKEETT